MKYPKKMRTHCPYCKKHTEHTVQRNKNKSRRKTAQGERRVIGLKKGYGGFPRPNPKGREKPTRRTDLRYKCTECNKLHTRGSGFRSKKFELKAKE